MMADGPRSWQLDRGHWWAPDGSALLVTRVVPADTDLPPATALLETRPLRLRAERRAAADRPALAADVPIGRSAGRSDSPLRHFPGVTPNRAENAWVMAD